MSVKKYCRSDALQDKVLNGVDKLVSNVSVTLGPCGRNVILQEKNKVPIITKDGVTVAKFVDYEDPFENAGAQIIKQVASQTNTQVGDGTTTSTVLAGDMLQRAQRFIKSGYEPVELKAGMDLAVKDVVSTLKKNAIEIQSLADIEHVATISANNDHTIGKLVSMAVDQAGKNGAISIEEARSVETSLEIVEGFVIEAGYVSPQFITDERARIAKYDDCLIFMTDHKLEFLEPVLPVLEIAARENRPLIIVADDIVGQFLAALIMNTARGSKRIVAIKAPHYGEERRSVLDDLAIST